MPRVKTSVNYNFVCNVINIHMQDCQLQQLYDDFGKKTPSGKKRVKLEAIFDWIWGQEGYNRTETSEELLSGVFTETSLAHDFTCRGREIEEYPYSRLRDRLRAYRKHDEEYLGLYLDGEWKKVAA